ncbi:MAG TPA: hypothetical protein VGW30_08355 [Gaiellaceae bacterium]|nr:hypothetical protein [Gaiellaceae bacterium]
MQRALVIALLALIGAGCSMGDDGVEDTASAREQPAACPAAWKPGWQELANDVGMRVYCPTWMPSPIDAEIGGQWNSDGVSVGKDRSYLAGFLWHEAGSGDVHVNFRGYAGKTAIPRCIDTQTSGGKTRRRSVPCFSDPQGTRDVGGKKVTVYTVSRDADQWHVTYVWREDGTLYAVSEHVAPPLTFRRVLENLDRIVSGLEPIEPKA